MDDDWAPWEDIGDPEPDYRRRERGCLRVALAMGGATAWLALGWRLLAP